MILRIRNADKVTGIDFWNGTFKCHRVHETDTNYRFQFKDRSPITRYIWVEVSKIGHWDRDAKEWVYALNYPNLKSQHLITAKWFEDWENAMNTFGGALKQSIN